MQKARLDSKAGKNRPSVPRKAKAKSSGQQLEDQLQALGHDAETIMQVRANSVDTRKRTRSLSRDAGSRTRRDRDDDNSDDEDNEDGDAVMEEDAPAAAPVAKRARTSASRSVSRKPSRSQSGLRDEKHVAAALKLAKKAQRRPNLNARAGEGDRVILNAMPKHLFAGKRKSGTHDRR
jgi:nucleolar GTP-binding protein